MNATKRLSVAAVMAALALLGAALFGGVADAAKKKKKRPATFSSTKVVNVPVPEDPGGTAPSVPLTSQITVGNRFKKKVVGDLNLTGFQSTGSGAGAATDLRVRLTAPGGRTGLVIEDLGDGTTHQSIGPLTLDDDTPTSLCESITPPCEDPTATLNAPWAGTANLLDVDDDVTTLSLFNGVRMKGVWTLTVWDQDDTGGLTSVLNGWGLQITPARPVR